MSYQSRDITVIIKLADDDFGKGNNELKVDGLRVETQINQEGGTSGTTMYAKIYGMKEADMLKCCTYAQDFLRIKSIEVTILAGDSISGMSQIFQGTITDGAIEYNETPSVPLVIQCRTGYLQQLYPVPPNSAAGRMDAKSMIKSLAEGAGFSFVGDGVTAGLQNHYSYGSAIQQIKDIARATGIGLDISNGVVRIWPSGQYADDHMVELSPSKGLIGYPTPIATGFIVNAEFTPDMSRGRKCRLTSSIARATGDFFIQNVTHIISSQNPGGPWMTTAHLTANPTVGV